MRLEINYKKNKNKAKAQTWECLTMLIASGSPKKLKKKKKFEKIWRQMKMKTQLSKIYETQQKQLVLRQLRGKFTMIGAYLRKKKNCSEEGSQRI